MANSTSANKISFTKTIKLKHFYKTVQLDLFRMQLVDFVLSNMK